MLSLAKNCGGGMERCYRSLWDYAAREFNAFCWLTLFAVTSYLSVRLFKLFKLWFLARNLPGPPCDGFYGHSELLSHETITDVLSNSHKKYGSIIKLWLDPTSLLVSIKDPELIREVLLKAEDKLPSSQKAFRMAFGRSSLFASSFDEVAERRQLLATELHWRLTDRATVLPTKLLDSIIEQLNEDKVERIMDCTVVSEHMTFTLLGTLLFGEAFLVWSKANIYEEILMRIIKDTFVWASYKVTPFWKRDFWRYQRLCTELKYLTQDILQQCKKGCKLLSQADGSLHDKPVHVQDEHSFGTPKQSIGLSFLSLLPDDSFPKRLSGHSDSREESYGTIMGLMFHGFLTTTRLINNMLSRLVAHSEIQNSIYSEIVAAKKASAKQDEYDIHHMHFLLATIYETARLLPAGPLLQRCSLKDDLNLKNGVKIPAGTLVVVPVQLVQTACSSWGSDATEFNPYRFLCKASDKVHDSSSFADSDKEEVDRSPGSFVLKDPKENIAFLPFGSGIRSCLGEKFVIEGVARLFTSLLEHYEGLSVIVELDNMKFDVIVQLLLTNYHNNGLLSFIDETTNSQIKIQPSTKQPVTNYNHLLHLASSPAIVFLPRNS